MTLEQYTSDQRARVPAHLQRRFEDMLATLDNPEMIDDDFAFRMIHAEVRFGGENVSIVGTVTGKETAQWNGGPRVMSSMVSAG